MDVREAVALSQGEEDTRRAAAVTLAAEAAVADATAGRTLPLLGRKTKLHKGSNRRSDRMCDVIVKKIVQG